MSKLEQVALLINGGVVLTVCYLYFFKKSSKMELPLLMEKPPKPSLKPYAKPSGKKKPKINDDNKAWKVENDLE